MKTREEILQIILNYEAELKDTMQEMMDTFGLEDAGTEREVTRYFVIEELLTRLNLNND